MMNFKMPEEQQEFLLSPYETRYLPVAGGYLFDSGRQSAVTGLAVDCKKKKKKKKKNLFSTQKTTDLLKKHNSLQGWLHRSLVWDPAPTPLPPRNPLPG